MDAVRFAGPDGTVRTRGPPDQDEAAALARIAGQHKVDAEPAAAAALAQLCTPAVRTAATRATTRPHWPLASWVGLLDTADGGLADVRTSLLVSVRQLADSGSETGRAAADLLAHLPATAGRSHRP